MSEKSMAGNDFDLQALYQAIDAKRVAEALSWAEVRRRVNRFQLELRPMSIATIRGSSDKTHAEGDGVLQLLLWLDLTPEHFMPSFANDEISFKLPTPPKDKILRWDTVAIYDGLNRRRQQNKQSWREVADEIEGFTASMLTRMKEKQGRVGFPHIMRLVVWMQQPSIDFMRISDF